MDSWQQHVTLEIADSFGSPERLLEITQALLAMHNAELIPEEIDDQLFQMIGTYNSAQS